MSDLHQIFEACKRIKWHLVMFPDEPITFDKAIRSEYKSSLRACLKAIGFIEANMSVLYSAPELRTTMAEYLRSIIGLNVPYVDTYGSTMHENPIFKALRDLTYHLTTIPRSFNETLTEENINRLADFEKLISASLDRRALLLMRFKLKYANMVDS